MAALEHLLYLLLVSIFSATVNAAYAITGPQGGVNAQTGERPFRQELRTFANSGAAWDLYIQALAQLQSVNQGDLLSYYQIGGIHGRPFIPWDGSNGPNGFTGYCTHNSILFPPWHRPYLALFEQVLWNNAQTIAASYPSAQKAKYQAAAVTFRIPYWDWALSPQMPSTLTSSQISINTPTGQKSISNPLHQYAFHPQPSNSDFPTSDAPISTYVKTVRYPTSSSPTANSQENKVNAQLQANGDSLHDSIYLLISRQSDYAPFSNQGYTGNNSQGYDSLESVHGTIHVLVGNGGHMADVPYAGFDPIFWLHHANVDRLFAIWQAIYPNSYVTPQVNQFGTFTTNPGASEDVNTPLTPFHKDTAGNFYTSVTARQTRTFGYSYPEVQDWGVDATTLAKNTRAAFKKLYDPTNQFTPRSLSSRQLKITEGNVVSGGILRNVSANTYREWLINIEVDKYALSGSFLIHFFLGASPPTDPASWSTDPSLVASFGVFVSSNTSSLPTDTGAVIIYGQVPLTRKLVAAVSAGTLQDLEPGTITPYLASNLQWRVQGPEGQGVPVGDVGGLVVSVADQHVEKTDAVDQFDRYGDLVLHTNVTENKGAGAREGYGL
ncbi:MAG: hypothetical protein M1836_004090 [Candelina mexicana]|nr:MAG: hypothetical protein M1836_004090 [Candelina mexicana]